MIRIVMVPVIGRNTEMGNSGINILSTVCRTKVYLVGNIRMEKVPMRNLAVVRLIVRLGIEGVGIGAFG